MAKRPPEQSTLLSRDKRYLLSRYIDEAMKKARVSEERLADMATEALSNLATSPAPAGVTQEEMALWSTFIVGRTQVSRLRNFPSRPFSTPYSRAVILGVTIALGLDRATVNRMAGGI